MTGETLAELRPQFETVVRAAFAGGHTYTTETPAYVTGERDGRPTLYCIYSAGVAFDGLHWADRIAGDLPPPPAELPPLDPGQQLGLSVLLKDAAVTPQVLADYLLDAGHEYATAVAERAKKEERARIVALVDTLLLTLPMDTGLRRLRDAIRPPEEDRRMYDEYHDRLRAEIARGLGVPAALLTDPSAG